MSMSTSAKTGATRIHRKCGRKHVWLYAPQQSRLRRTLFQIHLWIGLILSLYVVVIGLSGSALVFRQKLQQQIEPHMYQIKPAFHYASWNAVLESIRAGNPGFRVQTIVFPASPNAPAYAILAPWQTRRGQPQMRTYYFNPYTGRILGEENSLEGPLGWIANLHYFLFAGDAGLIVNGVMALGFLILCLTGIVLWWPGIKRWVGALVLKPRSSWQRLNWDLHSVVGFWCSAGLALIAFTGVYFAFPKQISAAMTLAMGGNPRQVAALLAPPRAPHASNAPTLSIDTVLQIAQNAFSENRSPAFLIFPDDPGGAYTVVGYCRDSAPYSQGTTLSIDTHTGAILKSVSTRQYPLGMQITQYFYTLHFGSFGGDGAFGIFIKILWMFLGVASAALGITGVLMYWNRFFGKRWAQWCRHLD